MRVLLCSLTVCALTLIAMSTLSAADKKSKLPGKVTSNKLGDTGTHELGHFRKRIDKSSPLIKKSGQQGLTVRKLGK